MKKYIIFSGLMLYTFSVLGQGLLNNGAHIVVGAGAYVAHRVISRNELIKKEEKIDSEIHDIGQKIADLNDKIDGAAVSTQEIHEELVKEVDLSQQAVAATEQAAAEEKAFEEMVVDAEEKRTEKLGQFEERLFKKRAGMLNKKKA
jgi:predicted small secreted protein